MEWEWTDERRMRVVNENESEPEHSLEEVVVGGFLVLALLSHRLHLPRVLHQTRVEVPSLGGRGILRGRGRGRGDRSTG